MKNIKFLIPVLLMAISSAFLTSCVKGEFDEPPINIPTVDFEANTTIQEFRESYSALMEITDDVVITGIVTANDESGNLYKKMIIQDETGALELAIDQTNLANEYKVGQRVYIKCKDLYVGDYNNLIQLGYIYNGGIGRMPAVMVPSHIFRDSLPGKKPVPQVVTLSDLGTADKANPVVSRLVTFENVMFATPGEVFAPQDVDATDRKLLDQSGNELVVRSSKYSNFSNNKIPQGYGKVTGILSLYRTTWQLTLRDSTDVTGFSGIIPPPPGSGDGTFEDPYNIESARSNSSTTPVWVKGFIVGVYETGGTEFVPNFAGPYTTNSNLLLADTEDETNLAKCVPVQLPAGAIREALNLVDNAANKGKEVMVLGTLESYFSVPGVKNLSGYWLDGNGVIPATGFFTEEFNNSLGTFSQFSVLGDQVWAGQTYDGGCVTMTGYVDGSQFANEDWLISPSISLAGKTGVTMKFREAMNFAGNINAEAKVFVSTNYTGTGDPNDADWTEMTGFTRSAGNSWTFVDCGDIDMSAFEGQTIHIGFKYMSTTSVAGTWEISRMLLTADNK
jgi:hypothetical protein